MLYPNICENGACENLQGTYRCVCDKGFTPNPNRKKCLGERKIVNGKKDLIFSPTSVLKKVQFFMCMLVLVLKCNLNHIDVLYVDTVKPSYPLICVICFTVLYDINFHSPLTFIYVFLHCVIQHPVFSDSKSLSQCLSDQTIFTVVFSYNVLYIIITDVNECERYPNYCDGGNCKNTIGSFHCTCPTGFRLNRDTTACEGNTFHWFHGTSSKLDGLHVLIFWAKMQKKFGITSTFFTRARKVLKSL